MRRAFFVLGFLLTVVPVVAVLVSTFHDGPPSERRATAGGEELTADPTPPSTFVRAAGWSLVAMPVGAVLVVKLGVRRRRIAPPPTGAHVYGVIAATVLVLLLLAVVVIGVLYAGPIGYGSVLVLEVVALVAWWQGSAFVQAVRLYPLVGRDPDWVPPEDRDEAPLLVVEPIVTTGAVAPPPLDGPIVR